SRYRLQRAHWATRQTGVNPAAPSPPSAPVYASGPPPSAPRGLFGFGGGPAGHGLSAVTAAAPELPTGFQGLHVGTQLRRSIGHHDGFEDDPMTHTIRSAATALIAIALAPSAVVAGTTSYQGSAQTTAQKSVLPLRVYQEMHVDGGAVAQVFIYPPDSSSRNKQPRPESSASAISTSYATRAWTRTGRTWSAVL
ncbi:MAG: hypothetical protein ACREYC_21075, partial [Gammaproteobacteria bacterium]